MSTYLFGKDSSNEKPRRRVVAGLFLFQTIRATAKGLAVRQQWL